MSSHESIPRATPIEPLPSDGSGPIRWSYRAAEEADAAERAEPGPLGARSVHIEPIEWERLYHFYPGSPVLALGATGAAQGAEPVASDAVREPAAPAGGPAPGRIVELAVELGCVGVVFVDPEPALGAEGALACRQRGVAAVGVLRSALAAEARAALIGALDAVNIELALPARDDAGAAQPALDPMFDLAAWAVRESETWVELTLRLPSVDGGDDERLRAVYRWMRDQLGRGVPLHLAIAGDEAQEPSRRAAPPAWLRRAYHLARSLGLRHVYTGPAAGELGASTWCPHCSCLLIERRNRAITQYGLERDGHCGKCAARIAGTFRAEPGRWGNRRIPVSI